METIFMNGRTAKLMNHISLNYQKVLILCQIQDYIKFIIKEYETLTKIRPIHIYVNRINNVLFFYNKRWI